MEEKSQPFIFQEEVIGQEEHNHQVIFQQLPFEAPLKHLHFENQSLSSDPHSSNLHKERDSEGGREEIPLAGEFQQSLNSGEGEKECAQLNSEEETKEKRSGMRYAFSEQKCVSEKLSQSGSVQHEAFCRKGKENLRFQSITQQHCPDKAAHQSKNQTRDAPEKAREAPEKARDVPQKEKVFSKEENLQSKTVDLSQDVRVMNGKIKRVIPRKNEGELGSEVKREEQEGVVNERGRGGKIKRSVMQERLQIGEQVNASRVVSPGKIKHTSRNLPPIVGKQAGTTDLTANESVLLGGNESSMVFMRKNIEANEKAAVVESEEDQAVLNIYRQMGRQYTKGTTVHRTKACFMSLQNPTFSLRDEHENFLVKGKKQWGNVNSHYDLSCSEDSFRKDSQFYAGCVKGNFSGSCFRVYHKKEESSEVVAMICYKVELKCRAVRKIQVFVRDPLCAFGDIEGSSKSCDLEQLFGVGRNAEQKKIVKLVNREPVWNQTHGCYFLDFGGKSRVPSVKNMIIEGEDKRQALLFCKEDDNDFRLEVSHPLSPFLAFAIILTSFDYKLLCQ